MWTVEQLREASLDEVLAGAAAVRDHTYGNRITYSPKVFIPLTMLCRDRCGYCTFAKAPARLTSPYLTPPEVLEIARAGQAAGCHEALFTLGELPEERYEVAAQWLGDNGYESTTQYLAAMSKLVMDETGLLAHTNAGALTRDDLELLRTVAASQGSMIESLDGDLEAHRLAPDKTPQRRLETVRLAGELAIPFTTGILVGIGNSRDDQLETLATIAQLHETYGHIQEVIVQNFLPKPGTAMAQWPPCDPDEFRFAIAAARLLLPPEIHLQAPPNLSDDFMALVDAGIDDFGGVSPVTADHVNPERAWPALDTLKQRTKERGFTLAPRMAVYPEFAADPERWLDPAVRFAVLGASDAESLARDSVWFSGSELLPPTIIGAGAPVYSGARSAVFDVLEGFANGSELGEDEIVTLFAARGPEVAAVAQAADALRREVVGDDITFVINRNINYTNVCTFKCKFCAFSKGPLSLNLRGDPYLLDLAEVSRRVAEAEGDGATEVCLQGGIHPKFDGEYYLDVIKAVREGSPTIHIHAFTALEVSEGARRSGVSVTTYLEKLRDAGLKTLPGTAAEILDDEVRAILCSDKINTQEWLDVHRAAHSVGLRSNVTIMFGSIEHPRSWAKHLIVTRELQRETGGFTEFVPLPFVHMATPIYLQKKARRGPTYRETLLMHSVGRLAYRGDIDNIQVSWVKLGVEGARQILNAGANDLGGTLMDENISRAAGAAHGQRMDAESLQLLVEPLGRPLVQRTTLYGRVAHAT